MSSIVGDKAPLAGVITMANPFDWMLIDSWLRKPLNKHVYNFILTKSLVQYLKTHKEVFIGHSKLDIDEVLNVRTLQEYDEKITCKLWVSF